MYFPYKMYFMPFGLCRSGGKAAGRAGELMSGVCHPSGWFKPPRGDIRVEEALFSQPALVPSRLET